MNYPSFNFSHLAQAAKIKYQSLSIFQKCGLVSGGLVSLYVGRIVWNKLVDRRYWTQQRELLHNQRQIVHKQNEILNELKRISDKDHLIPENFKVPVIIDSTFKN